MNLRAQKASMNCKDEFSLIRTLFTPLTQGFSGALELQDDAAIINPPDGYSIVAAADTIIAGVHFRNEDPPDLIARKLVRVNLSDMAAMGAKPWLMIMIAAFSSTIDKRWICRFTDGLTEDGQLFGIPLIGGDTVATPGPMSFSLTVFGLVEQGRLLRRSGACPGDILYVTGTVGDGALGLMLLQNWLSFDGSNIPSTIKYLQSRYYLPQPRIITGIALASIAHACVDISDGVLQDLLHLCCCSKVGAKLFIEHLPISPAASAIQKDTILLEAAVTGGDDYELLFTAPVSVRKVLEQLAVTSGIPITPIGVIVSADDGVSVFGVGGEIIKFPKPGYQHLDS